jgi:hypothetical protein
LLITETAVFLANTQDEVDQHPSRYAFSLLIENYYDRVITIALVDSSVIPEVFLPFEDRILIFNLLMNWSGDREAIAEGTEGRFLPLEVSSLRAMACLLQGPMSNETSKFDIKVILDWLLSIHLDHSVNVVEIAEKARLALLKYNHSDSAMMDDIFDACYTSEGDNMFRGLADSLMKMSCDEKGRLNLRRLKYHPHTLLCLLLCKLGDTELSTRMASISLLHVFGSLIGRKHRNDDSIAYEISSISSALPIIYMNSQATISCRFSIEYPEMSCEVFMSI